MHDQKKEHGLSPYNLIFSMCPPLLWLQQGVGILVSLHRGLVIAVF